MNRRGFIGFLASLPFVGKLSDLIPTKPKARTYNINDGEWSQAYGYSTTNTYYFAIQDEELIQYTMEDGAWKVVSHWKNGKQLV